MQVNNQNELQRAFAFCQKQVDALLPEARQQNNTEALQLLNQVWLRLRQGPVRTLVLGVSSAGKSTLINAVSGAVVVPEGRRTTSPIPVWVYSRDASATPKIRILKREETGTGEIQCGRYMYLTDYCYTSEQAGSGGGQEKYNDLIAATVNVDSPVMASSGITLIDTPGIGVSAGDNDRVQEVLKDGCEALIILFMTLQEEEVQTYFRNLLVEEDAPLRDLIEENRVFLVLNNVDESKCDIAKLDTQYHVKKTFDGWDCGDRLFAMNAQDARICNCGIYEYTELLPQGYSDESWEHAEKSLVLEKARAGVARPQKELDRLCRDLEEMVEEMCSEPWTVEAILAPIEEKLSRAMALLKDFYLEKRKEAEAAAYSAPAELETQRKQVSEQYEAMMAFHSWLWDGRDGLLDAPEKSWPAAALPRDLDLNPDYLLTEEMNRAESFLLEQIRTANGPGTIAVRIAERMRNRMRMLCDQLEDQARNPEARYWETTFSGLAGRLKDINAGMCYIPEAELTPILADLSDMVRGARAAGRTALLQSDCFQLTSADTMDLTNYLINKQHRILQGGIRGGFERFMLRINLNVDKLQPLLRRILTDARACYLRAYRQYMRQEYEKQYASIRAVMLKACVCAGKQKKALEEAVREEKQRIKAGVLAEIDAKIQHLTTVEQWRKDEDYD